MIETIVSGLILAGISALAYLAYSHPRQFKRIAPYLGGLAFLANIGIWLWAFAIMTAQQAVSRVQDGGKDEAYQDALAALAPPLWVMTVWFPVLIAFLVILHFWVTKLKDDPQSDSGNVKTP